jgi:hypothetical protein
VLAIMAVVTTLMTSPTFERLVGTGTYQPVTEPLADATPRVPLAVNRWRSL